MLSPCFAVSACRTEAPHSWTFPKILRKDKRLSIIKSACETDTEQFCSTLTLNSAHANQTGFYSCKYLPSAAPKGKQTESKIYVFVNGKISLFYIYLLYLGSGSYINPWSCGKVAFLRKARKEIPIQLYTFTECIFNTFLEHQFQPQVLKTRSVNAKGQMRAYLFYQSTHSI